MASWYTLGIFVILYLLSFLDRQILGLLLLPIQKDLNLSDIQLGAVHGIAFSLFYTTVGLLLAWAIDRYSIKWLLFGGVVIWSLSTIACGLAGTFGHLFSARLLVGFGEAVVAPAALVVLSATFPPRRLGLAMGIYYGSTNIGSALVFIGGGAVVQALTNAGGLSVPGFGLLQPWQGTFVLLGAPGLVLAFLAFLIVTPSRSVLTGDRDDGRQSLVSFLRQNRRIFLIHMTAFALMCMSAYAVIAWTPAFLERRYGWEPFTIGLIVGCSNGLFGFLGNLFWGSLADRFTRRGHTDGVFLAFMIALVVGTPVGLATFLVPNGTVAVIGICATWFLLLSQGSLNAALGLFVPVHLRARVSALSGVGVAVFAIGLTPMAVGILTDKVYQDRAMVGASIATLMIVCSAAAFLLLALGRKPLRDSVARLREATSSVA